MRIQLASMMTLAAVSLLGCGDDASHRSATTQLVQYQSCDALEDDLRQMLHDEADSFFDHVDEWGWGLYPPSAEDADSGGGREEGVDYSGTNNQESGVDEADLVKTDGYHIYTVNGNRLHIFGVPQFGELTAESVTELEGHPRELLIDQDSSRAAVFSYVSVYNLPEDHPLRALVGATLDDTSWYWRVPELTKITILDISDATSPVLLREVFFEGWYQTARKVDTSVRLSAYSWLLLPGIWSWWDYYSQAGQDIELGRMLAHHAIASVDLGDLIPQIYERHADGQFSTHSLDGSACSSFYRPTDSHARGVSSILSFDLADDNIGFDSDHVITNWATFYASQDTLILAEPAHDWWWYWTWNTDLDQLNVHAFDIRVPGQSTYIGSGRVDGLLFDSFSIDEEGGYVRLATTSNLWGRWWVEDPPPIENNLFVLALGDGSLDTVGHLGGIAPGETITSARLLGDKGFLVTFEQIDPLHTLDLSNPREPRIVGELEVPGFSTYLHPIGDDFLLSIGVGGDENGANWQTTVSLYDVSDFANPGIASTLPLEMDDGWGWSEALWEHKAFQYWAPKQLLAVPQSSYVYAGTTPEGWEDYRYLSRLEVITVDTASGLSRKGSIDHSAYYNSDPNQYWSYVDIRRSIFMGEFLYAISDRAITVHNVDDLTQVTAQTLPGYDPSDYYWWW